MTIHKLIYMYVMLWIMSNVCASFICGRVELQTVLIYITRPHLSDYNNIINSSNWVYIQKAGILNDDLCNEHKLLKQKLFDWKESRATVLFYWSINWNENKESLWQVLN